MIDAEPTVHKIRNYIKHIDERLSSVPDAAKHRSLSLKEALEPHCKKYKKNAEKLDKQLEKYIANRHNLTFSKDHVDVLFLDIF